MDKTEEDAREFIDWFKKVFLQRFGVTPEVKYDSKPVPLEHILLAVNTVLNRDSTQFYEEGIKTTWMRNGHLVLHRQLYYKVAKEFGHKGTRAAKFIGNAQENSVHALKVINQKLFDNDEQTKKAYEEIYKELRANQITRDADKEQSNNDAPTAPA
jgi:hypothetical protein